jgi:hypothetical protein
LELSFGFGGSCSFGFFLGLFSLDVTYVVYGFAVELYSSQTSTLTTSLTQVA